MSKIYPAPGRILRLPPFSITGITRPAPFNFAPQYTTTAGAVAGRKLSRARAKAAPYCMTPAYFSWMFEQDDDYFGSHVVNQVKQFGGDRLLVRPPPRSVVIAGQLIPGDFNFAANNDCLALLRDAIISRIGPRLESAGIWCGMFMSQAVGDSVDGEKFGVVGPGLCGMPASEFTDATGSGSFTAGGGEFEFEWFFSVPVIDTTPWHGRECLFIWLKSAQFFDYPNMFGFFGFTVGEGGVISYGVGKFQNVIDGARVALDTLFGSSSDVFERQRLVCLLNTFDPNVADYGDLDPAQAHAVQLELFDREQALYDEVFGTAGSVIRFDGQTPPFTEAADQVVSQIEDFYGI